jgi:RimJ/RimL family protein N-acetyltransferase
MATGFGILSGTGAGGVNHEGTPQGNLPERDQGSKDGARVMTDGGVQPVRLTGWRLVLRDPVASDLDGLRYWLEPDHRWQELDGPASDLPDPAERELILRARRQIVAATNQPVPRRLLSIAAVENDELLGQVTWEVVRGERTTTPGLNIVIYNPDLWGYGLGYEALGLWIDYLFGADLSLPSLELRTWNRNQGMVRLAHKLGFDEVTPQRRRRGFGILSRRPEGMGFVLLRESWGERFPNGFAASLRGDE